MNKEEMLTLRIEGLTYSQIARAAQISRQRVQQIISPPGNIQKMVLNKYGKRCSSCGIFVGESGHIHHMDITCENYNDFDNLELLCPSCHRIKHNGRPGITREAILKEKEDKLNKKKEILNGVNICIAPPICTGNPLFDTHHEPVKMHKSGLVLSGKNKVPRWRCVRCGRTTTKLDNKE